VRQRRGTYLGGVYVVVYEAAALEGPARVEQGCGRECGKGEELERMGFLEVLELAELRLVRVLDQLLERAARALHCGSAARRRKGGGSASEAAANRMPGRCGCGLRCEGPVALVTH
jgi:hypothetical protein